MDRYADIAAELVRQKVDVIVTYSTSTVIALKRATPVIPIVFVSATDPVGNGLVESLPRPGGNATGLSNQSADSVGKRLEILREVVPTFRRLAILCNVGAPNAVLEMEEVQAAARGLGLSCQNGYPPPQRSRLPLRQSRAARTRSMSSWTRS